MRSADLRLLYKYAHDRNMKLLEKTGELSDEQFAGDPPFGHDSVKQIFFHIARAENGWRSAWQTGERQPPIELADYPDLPAIRTLLDETSAETLAYIDSLSDDDLDGDFNGAPLWQTMTHVFNHGTQHRSEIAMLLTHFGHSPGDLDLAYFVFERAAE